MATNRERRERSVHLKDNTFLTKEELATRWKVCSKTIEQWVKKGLCPKPGKLGERRVRWKLVDIEAHEERYFN